MLRLNRLCNVASSGCKTIKKSAVDEYLVYHPVKINKYTPKPNKNKTRKPNAIHGSLSGWSVEWTDTVLNCWRGSSYELKKKNGVPTAFTAVSFRSSYAHFYP